MRFEVKTRRSRVAYETKQELFQSSGKSIYFISYAQYLTSLIPVDGVMYKSNLNRLAPLVTKYLWRWLISLRFLLRMAAILKSVLLIKNKIENEIK